MREITTSSYQFVSPVTKIMYSVLITINSDHYFFGAERDHRILLVSHVDNDFYWLLRHFDNFILELLEIFARRKALRSSALGLSVCHRRLSVSAGLGQLTFRPATLRRHCWWAQQKQSQIAARALSGFSSFCLLVNDVRYCPVIDDTWFCDGKTS